MEIFVFLSYALNISSSFSSFFLSFILIHSFSSLYTLYAAKIMQISPNVGSIKAFNYI